MNKLYYGRGICYVSDGPEMIRGLEINYTSKGSAVAYKSNAVKIQKTTNNNFAMVRNNKKIIIFPVGEGFLSNLFKYSGSLIIKSVIAAGRNGKQVQCSVEKMMDHAELLHTKAEDMTTKSGNLIASDLSYRKIQEHKGIVGDLHSNNEFYLSDGSPYMGAYHIYLEDNRCKTGNRPSGESQDLYVKQIAMGITIDRLIPTKNPSHVPQALAVRKKLWKKKPSFKKVKKNK